MVPPGASVFPEVSVGGRQVGLRLPHGQVGRLAGVALLQHLGVVLGLEPATRDVVRVIHDLTKLGQSEYPDED